MRLTLLIPTKDYKVSVKSKKRVLPYGPLKSYGELLSFYHVCLVETVNIKLFLLTFVLPVRSRVLPLLYPSVWGTVVNRLFSLTSGSCTLSVSWRKTLSRKVYLKLRFPLVKQREVWTSIEPLSECLSLSLSMVLFTVHKLGLGPGSCPVLKIRSTYVSVSKKPLYRNTTVSVKSKSGL